MDRVSDLPTRLVKLTRNGNPAWSAGHRRPRRRNLPAARPRRRRGVGEHHLLAHRCGRRTGPRTGATSERRFSETAKVVDPDSRLPPPRYWLLHTLAHMLIREMAMSCGYGAASLGERLYGWPAADGQPAGGRAADLHDGLGQRGHPGRPGRSCASRSGCRGWSPRRCAARPAAPQTRSAPCGPPGTPRTSCTARRATAAPSHRKPRARGPTGSSTAASCSTCRGARLGFFTGEALLGEFLTGTEAKQIADRLGDGETLTVALRAVAAGRRARDADSALGPEP